MKDAFLKITEKINKIEANRRQLRNEIEQLACSTKDLDQQIETAAAGGDIDLYISLGQKKAKAEAAIEVKQYQLDHISDISDDEIREAWDTYVKGYAKEFNEKFNNFQTAKEKYLDAFRDAMILQNNGLKARQRIALLLNMQLSTGDISHRLPLPVLALGGIVYGCDGERRVNEDVKLYEAARNGSEISKVALCGDPVREEVI